MSERVLALSTDLYELAMAAGYFENGLSEQRAIFELFIRSLPPKRSYLISAGLEQVLEYLTSLRFDREQIDYLRHHQSFAAISDQFFDFLSDFRFRGDVEAVPEGTVVFGMEPILRVSAPIIQAQIVETFLLSAINFQTMIATKASRLVTAASGRGIIEFGGRRAHGSEAGLLAARASYIGGCQGTSNVEAGHLFGVPTFGTLAHSFVMSFDKEDDAFEAFLKVFPNSATLLVDTYDTVAAVERLARRPIKSLAAVRLDSGDLRDLSVAVRNILDRAGMTETKIFASGDLNEYRIRKLLDEGAKIDSFGVGTELATSYDSPALSGVYKLVGLEQEGKMAMRMKLSRDKVTYPGAKQVWRRIDEQGFVAGDVIALSDEQAPPHGKQSGTWNELLQPVMRKGELLEEFAWMKDPEAMPIETRRRVRFDYLNKARANAVNSLAKLPGALRMLDPVSTYSVSFSDALTARKQELEQSIRSKLRNV